MESYYYVYLGVGIVLKYNVDVVSIEFWIIYGFRYGNGM